MAIYHLFPGPESLKNHPEIREYLANVFLNEKSNVIKIAKKLKQKLYYLFDENSMNTLRHHLEEDPDDIKLVLHADGTPFVIGFNQRSPFDLTAVGFAEKISVYLPINRHVQIDLLSCNSATDFDELNFAKNTSFVFDRLGYDRVVVSGYTGFVVEKSNAKFSVSSEYGESKKGNHASLEDAVRTYQGGRFLRGGGREMQNWDEATPQPWMLSYMNKAIEDLRFFQPASKTAHTPEASATTIPR